MNDELNMDDFEMWAMNSWHEYAARTVDGKLLKLSISLSGERNVSHGTVSLYNGGSANVAIIIFNSILRKEG